MNGILISNLAFDVDPHGYVHPYYPTAEQLDKMNLAWGKNDIEFKLGEKVLKS